MQSEIRVILSEIIKRHRWIISTMIVVMALSYYLQIQMGVNIISPQADRLFQLIVVIFSAACIYVGYGIYKKSLVQLRDQNVAKLQRLQHYGKAMMYGWILLILPFLLSIACYTIIGNTAFLAMAFLIWLIIALLAPSKQLIELLLK